MALDTLHLESAPATPLPLAVALAIIPSLPIPLLSFVATRLIDRLDALEGDPELEPSDSGDDGLHFFNDGYRAGWGCGEGYGAAVPEYGADQSQPPLNWQGTFASGEWGC